jgi:hypothetical protein
VATPPAVIGDTPTAVPVLPPVKMVNVTPIRAALDKINAKNWRMVKKYLLAKLPPAVVGSKQRRKHIYEH